MLGRVSAFDEQRGLGSIADEAGHEHGFHCVALADGSRTIEVGAAVVYVVVPGHLGRLECRSVRRLPPPA